MMKSCDIYAAPPRGAFGVREGGGYRRDDAGPCGENQDGRKWYPTVDCPLRCGALRHTPPVGNNLVYITTNQCDCPWGYVEIDTL